MSRCSMGSTICAAFMLRSAVILNLTNGDRELEQPNNCPRPGQQSQESDKMADVIIEGASVPNPTKDPAHEPADAVVRPEPLAIHVPAACTVADVAISLPSGAGPEKRRLGIVLCHSEGGAVNVPYVQRVMPGGLAIPAGIVPGQKIMALNGATLADLTLETIDELFSAACAEPASAVTLSVAAPTQQVFTYALRRTDAAVKFGLFVHDGIITAIAPDSPAALAGMVCGHVLMRVGARHVVDCSDEEIVAVFAGDALELIVETMPEELFYCLTSG
eukprot:m.119509 g.119509  ORF g.119509 m.119509 type:complete len:275 (-) comp9256_c3_seq5:143-967(-)